MFPPDAPPPRYEVLLTEPVEIEIDTHHARLATIVSEAFADRWQDLLIAKINGLYSPQVYPIAPENDLYDVEVRRLLYYGPSGRRKGGAVYRVLFYTIEIPSNLIHLIS